MVFSGECGGILGELFGTDGIRGVANQYPLDCETAVVAGRAIAAHFDEKKDGTSRFLIGQDTRISGDMLASALAAGICSMGKNVHLANVIPTPGVAYLTRIDEYDAGIVISASHNPFSDNGIKLFGGDGYKLNDDEEGLIEKRIQDSSWLSNQSRMVQRTGSVTPVDDAQGRYRRFLENVFQPTGRSLSGLKLVVDGSNGAASQIAPPLFKTLGATVTSINCQPNGTNINDQCGSQHPEALAKQVVADKADLGLAFDGDADRLIAVDERGTILTGDQVLAICAQHALNSGKLTNSIVVTTVMSNMGLGAAFDHLGIEHIKTSVGDRYVVQEMRKSGAVIGGEDSGHMIFMDQHTTGDGLLAALKLLEAMQSSGNRLSELTTVMTVFPQCLINVDVQAKPEITSIDAIMNEIQRAETALKGKGRVLVRYSGTQPQCRVMVEGPSDHETNTYCQRIADVVAQQLG